MEYQTRKWKTALILKPKQWTEVKLTRSLHLRKWGYWKRTAVSYILVIWKWIMHSSVLENVYLIVYGFISGMQLTCVTLCCEKALAFGRSQFRGGGTLLSIGTMFMKWIIEVGTCGTNWVENLPFNSVLSPAFWVTLGKSFTLFMSEFLLSDTWKILLLNHKKLMSYVEIAPG